MQLDQLITYIDVHGPGNIILAIFLFIYYKFQSNMSQSLLLMSQAVHNSTKAVERLSENLSSHAEVAKGIDTKVDVVKGDTSYIRDEVNQIRGAR